MKIGVFDSGLGGLIVAKSLMESNLGLTFAYLGDTANLPYGNKSADKIYECSRRSVDYLFREQDCSIIIIACNTASITALRRLQREYLPENFPDRRILGIAIPTLEHVMEKGHKNIGLIATNATVKSGLYDIELKKLDPEIKLESLATPLLVPLIEDGGDKYAEEILRDYLAPFHEKDALILGCTHYPKYKELIRKILPGVDIISQDEIIPGKLADYLARHPEFQIEKNGSHFFGITDLTENYIAGAKKLFGMEMPIAKVAIEGQ